MFCNVQQKSRIQPQFCKVSFIRERSRRHAFDRSNLPILRCKTGAGETAALIRDEIRMLEEESKSKSKKKTV